MKAKKNRVVMKVQVTCDDFGYIVWPEGVEVTYKPPFKFSPANGWYATGKGKKGSIFRNGQLISSKNVDLYMPELKAELKLEIGQRVVLDWEVIPER